MMALSAKHDWDLAAAEIIVSEAGGIVTTHSGATLRLQSEDDASTVGGCGRAGAACATFGAREPSEPIARLGGDMADRKPQQLLHLVFGGELVSPATSHSRTCPSSTWWACIRTTPWRWTLGAVKAQATVDNAQMRYFVVHIHRADRTGRRQLDGVRRLLLSPRPAAVCYAAFR